MIIQAALIYIQTLILALSINVGNATNFGPNDPGNPNPHLACMTTELRIKNPVSVRADMPVVATRTDVACGSELIICDIGGNKCTRAIVADRLGNHCAERKKGKCIKYYSNLDMTNAVRDAIGHDGYGPVFFIVLEQDEWQRKQNLRLLLKKKNYVRLNS